MRRGRAVRQTGRALSTARTGWVPPIPSLSPTPSSAKTLPPQPEGGGTAARPGTGGRAPGSRVREGGGGSGPSSGRPGGCGPHAKRGGRELLAARREPRRPPPPAPTPAPGGCAARASLSSPRRASVATPEAAGAATHHITDGGDVSDSH